MLLPLKAIILTKPRKDGNYLIYFQYCFSGAKRVLMSTEIVVPLEYWNKKRQCISNSLPESFGKAFDLNNELRRMRTVIERLIEYCHETGNPDVCKFLKKTFAPTLSPQSISTKDDLSSIQRKAEPDFFEELAAYQKSKEKKIVSTRIISALRERLLSYQQFSNKKVTFSGLDFNFYNELVDFLAYDYVHKRRTQPQVGLKVSTIGSTIKHLRVFINDRKKRKIISGVDLSDFKIMDEEADSVYLSYEEIARVYRLDLSDHQHLAKDRDLFVLGCLTGLRFSDFSKLNANDLRKGLLYKKTDKQGSWVVIPMRTEAIETFNRVFSNDTTKVYNSIFNKNIKEIGQLAGLNEVITFSYKKGRRDVVVSKPKALWITSHTCRRSFCTNEYMAGTDVSLIMKISGHKTHKDFFRYIKISQEEAARKMQEVWLTRGNMSAFNLIPK